MFENSKWISNSKMTSMRAGSHLGSIMLRKTFEIGCSVTKATLYCCGLGQAVYYLNESRVTNDVYVTHFTKYDSRTLYNIFDITPLICQGKNTVAVHLGNWFYNDCNPHWNRSTQTWRAQPKLLLEIKIEYDNGEVEYVKSDSSWKVCNGPVVYNNMQSGEVFDARLIPNNWNNNFCDQSKWSDAVVCTPAGGKLEHIEMPPVRVVRRLIPKSIGDGIYDCGEGISGRARVFVSGNAGDEIQIKYGEYIDPDGKINEHINLYLDTMQYKHTDKYILSGNGKEEFAPEFVFHGFRYVKISGTAKLCDLVFEVIHNDFEIIGEFECSDEMINKIHRAARRSTLTNYIDIPLDCPHREQNGWTGDALISCEQALMNFEMRAAYRKWMNDFKDAQRPSGQLPAIIPSSNWGYNWGAGPAWDSAIIMIPYFTYQKTGDPSLIVQMWDNMKLYMEYMLTMQENYLVDYGLGDWKPPHKEVKCPAMVTDTGYFYANAKIMSVCSHIMGEVDIYKELAKKIKAAYRNRFLNNDEYLKSQTFIACGIYHGLYNAEEIPEMAKKLAQLVIDNDYHIDCGILGTKYIFTALSETGYADVLYKMVTNPTAPSYAYWINLGLKNFCEQWHLVNGSGEIESLNHHMFSEVEHWFYKHLAGIQINAKELVINPCFVKELDWVKAKHQNTEVYWDKKKLTVTTDVLTKVIINGTEYTVKAGAHTFDITN